MAIRSILKNKSYIVINTFGLGVSLACCITAYMLLAYNIEFDQFYDNSRTDKIFRMHTVFEQPDGGEGQHINSPINIGPAVAQDIAGIERYTRYGFGAGYLRYGEKAFSEGIVFADSTFYEMFDYKVLKGDIGSFHNKNSIVLTEEIAEKYFADDNPIGKVLILNAANQTEIQVVVGAVIEKPPLNVSMYFDIMMRMENFMDIYGLSTNEWGDWRDPALLVELTYPSNAVTMSPLFTQYVDLRNEMRPDVKVLRYELHPFKENVNQDDIGWSQINLRISNVPLIIFSVMALMILLIACFNLTNTSFAITARRLKEVGIRKVVGASRFNIIAQFIFEMILIILFSLVVGLIISRFVTREFADMWEIPYTMKDLNGLNLLVSLLILVFGASLVAGLYPALTNSRYQPVTLLKGNVKIKGTNLFTKSLVTIQFAISVIVLINGLVFIQNTKFQERVDYGFDMKNVLALTIQDEGEYRIMKERIKSHPKVQEVSITHHQLGMSSYPFPVQMDTTEYQVQHIEVGENFFETMGMTLKQGRFLDFDIATDEFNSIVVNEAFLDHVGLSAPIGAIVKVREDDRRIVGVILNHVDNLYRSREPEPFVYYASKRNEYQLMLVRGEEDDLKEINSYMEEVWKEEIPTKPYNCRYQEDINLGNMRQTNTNLKKIFIFLTILGGLLSASGIFALASLNVDKRTKEIGIRKTLGASISHMIRLLSREFAWILAIAAIIGSVGGYFLTTVLLDQIYAYHITVGIIPIFVAALAVAGVGLATTGSTILQAARANPIISLRDE